jgi:hypothetical protein
MSQTSAAPSSTDGISNAMPTGATLDRKRALITVVTTRGDLTADTALRNLDTNGSKA